MSQTNGRTPLSHKDIHAAASALYAELSRFPWFVAVECDAEHGVLIVETNDMEPAQKWEAQAPLWGWPITIKKGGALRRNPSIGEAEELVS